MYREELNLNLDDLQSYLSQLATKLGEGINADNIASAITMAEGLSDGEEEDLEFVVNLKGEKVPFIIKASVTHNTGPKFSVVTSSQELFNAITQKP